MYIERQIVFDHTDLLKQSPGSVHQESVITGNDAMFTKLILQIIISFLKLLSSLSAHGSKKVEIKQYSHCSTNGGKRNSFLHHSIFDFRSLPAEPGEVIKDFPHTPILLCRLLDRAWDKQQCL